MRKRPTRLWLEALEDRWCPSLTVQNVSGYLIISGTPVGTNAAGGLLIKGAAGNNFTVKDGASNLGTYHVTGNVMLNLTNHQSEGINIDLNSNSIPGNLIINLGNGNNTGNTQFATAVYNSSGRATTGQIGGYLQVLNGSGAETVIVGFQNNFSNTPPAFGLKVGGDLTFNAKVGGPTPSTFDVLDTGAGAAAAGAPTPTVVVGGNFNTTAVDVVGLGPTTTVGKSVSISAAGERPLFVQDFATVQGSVSVTGSQLLAPNPVLGASQQGNFIEIGGFPTGTAVVGGSLQLSGAGGNNAFLIDAGTQVNGTASITSGSGSDNVNVSGTFNSTLSLNLGDGNDSVTLNAGTSLLSSLSITDGNGNDSITQDASVGSGLSFHLGNGNDTVTVGSAPGGQLLWTSGSGNDSVTFGDAHDVGGETWNVNMRFGTGNDTLTLAGNGTVAAPDGLTGFIDMGGPPGGNSFDPTGSLIAGTWVIVEPFTLQNV